MKSTFRIALVIAALAFTAVSMSARRINSTRQPARGDRPQTSSAEIVEYDTIVPEVDDVVLSGYEKPLRSNRETNFVTNNLDCEIEAIVFTTGYYDLDGNEIHRRQVRRRFNIPPRTTRRLDYPSWDVQRTYYYVDTPPTRAEGTPYTVRQRIDTIFVTPISPTLR